jgi:hypothetical protein
MAIMIANGASSGSLSPIAPTGIVVEGITTKDLGLGDVRWQIYFNNLIAHVAIAWTAYIALGGWRLLRRQDLPPEGGSHGNPAKAGLHDSSAGLHDSSAGLHDSSADTPFTWKQWLTCAVIVALVASVIFLELNVGLAAFAGAVLLTLTRAADETAAVKAVPWGVIMMVSGVTLLVTMVDKNGGMALFADFLSQLATPASVTAVAAFFSGVISIYSSTIGVVLPALLPTVDDLIANINGGDALAIVSSMIVGGHLVDVSPLSTLGALCMASAPPGTNARRLFTQLLLWGVSMTVVSAAVCWVFFR